MPVTLEWYPSHLQDETRRSLVHIHRPGEKPKGRYLSASLSWVDLVSELAQHNYVFVPNRRHIFLCSSVWEPWLRTLGTTRFNDCLLNTRTDVVKHIDQAGQLCFSPAKFSWGRDRKGEISELRAHLSSYKTAVKDLETSLTNLYAKKQRSYDPVYLLSRIREHPAVESARLAHGTISVEFWPVLCRDVSPRRAQRHDLIVGKYILHLQPNGQHSWACPSGRSNPHRSCIGAFGSALAEMATQGDVLGFIDTWLMWLSCYGAGGEYSPRDTESFSKEYVREAVKCGFDRIWIPGAGLVAWRSPGGVFQPARGFLVPSFSGRVSGTFQTSENGNVPLLANIITGFRNDEPPPHNLRCRDCNRGIIGHILTEPDFHFLPASSHWTYRKEDYELVSVLNRRYR